MTVPGWKVVFFSGVVFSAAAEVAEEEVEAVGEQMEDLEGEDQPGMGGLEDVDHLLPRSAPAWPL
jgi:hypothetical protein